MQLRKSANKIHNCKEVRNRVRIEKAWAKYQKRNPGSSIEVMTAFKEGWKARTRAINTSAQKQRKVKE